MACAGYPLNCWFTFRGPATSWACPFSSCLHRPSTSTPTRHAPQRRSWTGPVGPPCRSTAGCRAGALSSSATPHSLASSSSRAVRGYFSIVTRLRLDAKAPSSRCYLAAPATHRVALWARIRRCGVDHGHPKCLERMTQAVSKQVIGLDVHRSVAVTAVLAKGRLSGGGGLISRETVLAEYSTPCVEKLT